MITLPPETARQFADAGCSKQDILTYVKEYNRRPSSEIPRAAIGNNHPRKGLVFPAPGLVHSAPLFWNTEHMFVHGGRPGLGHVLPGRRRPRRARLQKSRAAQGVGCPV